MQFNFDMAFYDIYSCMSLEKAVIKQEAVGPAGLFIYDVDVYMKALKEHCPKYKDRPKSEGKTICHMMQNVKFMPCIPVGIFYAEPERALTVETVENTRNHRILKFTLKDISEEKLYDMIRGLKYGLAHNCANCLEEAQEKIAARQARLNQKVK